MYSFQAGNVQRKRYQRTIRLLVVLLFIALVALVGVSVAYVRQGHSSSGVTDALSARALSEASDAQAAVYRLTQSSGTNTMSLLSAIRSHIYALQCLNTLTANIYGADARLVDGSLLAACTETLDACEVRLQAGGVLTTQFTQLRDEVEAVAAQFGL